MITRLVLVPRGCPLTFLLPLLLLAGCPEPKPALGPGLREADRLLGEGQPAAALTRYQAALQEPPKGHAQRGIGLSYEALGQREPALQAMEAAKKSLPEDPVVRLALCRLYIAANKQAEALAEAQHVFEHHPDNLTALIMLGALAQSPEQVQKALDRLESWRSDPTQKRVAVAELYVALWDLWMRKGDANAARDTLKQAATAPIGNPDAAILMTSTYVGLGHRLAAEQLLLAVVRAEPKRADAQRRLAFLATDLDHYAVADRALDTFTSDPRKLDETILRAKVNVALEQAGSVIEELRDRIARGDVDHPSPERRAQLQYWLGKALAQTGDLAGAKLALAAAIELWPEMTPAHLALAELRLRDRELDTAIAGLDAVIVKQPDAADLHGLLGSAHMTKGDYVRAEAAFRRRAELTPKDATGAHLIGVALKAQGKNAEAQAEFQRALTLDPAAIDPLEALASMLLSQHKPEEAEALHQHAVAAVPGRIEAWIAFARFYLRVNNNTRASAVIQQALRQAPEHVGALGEAAQIALRVGDYAQAEQLSVRLLAVRPSFVPALNNLAVLYDEHLNQPDKALEAAQKAHELAPNDPHIQDTLGWILHRRGQPQRAVELLRQSATQLDKNAVIHFHYGMARIGSGERDAGKAELQKALKLDPTFQGAAEARAAL